VSDKVGGPALQTVCRRAATAASPASCFSAASQLRLRPRKKSNEGLPAEPCDRLSQLKACLAKSSLQIKDSLERELLHVSVLLCLVGSVGLCWPIIKQLPLPTWVSSAEASVNPPVSRCQRFSRCHGKAEGGLIKPDPFNGATYAPSVKVHATTDVRSHSGRERLPSPAGHAWSRSKKKSTERARPLRAAHQSKPKSMPGVRLTSLEDAASPMPFVNWHGPFNFGTRTSLEEFETAPFPYHGMVPGSGRPFLNAGSEGRLGHVNFRGQVLWESETFSNDRVLLHIPPSFDPRRPAVMVVFFHGHGASLTQDVLDRQQVPEQITAAGANAVLVAPQFAFNAADSSAGKFWEPNGFKRFLDEAAVKLARMYGDPRMAWTFSRMPIVIVAYSGGFAPTLSVLERGGVRSRVRGLVLLDALYGGIDKFGDWIAANRSTFFISSYTPHNARRNADLENLLRKRSVPYSSQLRNYHLQGMVSFLPAGDISHRDFVTHAWADYPIRDVLVRMDESDLRIETATAVGSSFPGTFASRRY
jgi:hypothetical protein